MYAARESFSATAQRLLASSKSSDSLREIALIDMSPEYLIRVSIHDIRMAVMVNPDVAGDLGDHRRPGRMANPG
jgi:hypothetical protein